MRLWDIQLERTCVIGAGVDPFFTPSDTTPMSLRNIGVTKDFVFCVGRADPRKQTAFAIEMFAALPEQTRGSMQLVISCRVDDNQKLLWHELGTHLGLSENQLVITGLVTDDLLRTLYSKSSVFVEPSLYEGFGFPIAEAASCGTVVISSNTSSMIEILEWPESTFDPEDLTAASLLLDRAINDDSYRVRNLETGKMVRTRHSWDEVAIRAISAIDKLARRIEVPKLQLNEIDTSEFPSKAIGRTFPITDFDL
jgi:glycosyltransferase involved in cell wall biosynthesis